MDSSKAQKEINRIISELHERIGAKAARKQYPVGKAQRAELERLGLLDLMPAGFGHSDAAAVLAEAAQGWTAVFNAEGEGEEIPATELHALVSKATEKPQGPTTETRPQGQRRLSMKQEHAIMAARDAGERAAKIFTTYNVQQGSSNMIRFQDEAAWYVVKEVSDGTGRTLNITGVSQHADFESADAACKELRNS